MYHSKNGIQIKNGEVNSYIKIPEIQLPENGEFTIAMRWFVEKWSGNCTIYQADIPGFISSTTDSTSTIRIGRHDVFGSRLLIEIEDGTGPSIFYNFENTLLNNQWQHLVLVFKPSEKLRIFLNKIELKLEDSKFNTKDERLPKYNNKVLKPAKSQDSENNKFINGSITFGTLRKDETTINGFISTYQVFGKAFIQSDVDYWHTKLNGNDVISYDPSEYNQYYIGLKDSIPISYGSHYQSYICESNDSICAPTPCRGEFSACDDNCNKKFKIIRDAALGGLECLYRNEQIVKCNKDDDEKCKNEETFVNLGGYQYRVGYSPNILNFLIIVLFIFIIALIIRLNKKN